VLGAQQLPRTGLDGELPVAVGLSCVFAGVLLVARRRGSWLRSGQ
jgi:LPXTG-motif cell wall-anchored protein